MESLFLAGLFAVSSVLLATIATRPLRLSRRLLRATGRALIEFTGLWAICVAANLVIGALSIIAIRTLTPLFVSMYLVNDVSVVVVSALQGFVLHAWLSRSR